MCKYIMILSQYHYRREVMISNRHVDSNSKIDVASLQLGEGEERKTGMDKGGCFKQDDW